MPKITPTNPTEFEGNAPSAVGTANDEQSTNNNSDDNSNYNSGNAYNPNNFNVSHTSDQSTTTETFDQPNSIKVTINDDRSPIVILFGPPACGKTMALVRLTRYLNHAGYSVKPVREFRNSSDINYRNLCDNFDNSIIDDKAAPSTDNISFMLIKICDKQGNTICQLLEAPGELYYNVNKLDADFPRYVDSIMKNDARKIWLFMVENQWQDQRQRDGYVYRIRKLIMDHEYKPNKNKAIILFNKIDQTEYMPQGNFNTQAAHRYISQNFPGIFDLFKTKGVFGKKMLYTFIPFSSGKFYDDRSYSPSSDDYPKKLWAVLSKIIKG